MAEGSLKVEVHEISKGRPVEGAQVTVYDMDSIGNRRVVAETTCDSSGQTEDIPLECPPADYTEAPNLPKPYKEYFISVNADEREPVEIHGIQVFGGAGAIQPVRMMRRLDENSQAEGIAIKPHVLWGDYPPKIPEAEVKELPPETGFVVLDKPVIPETIVVHDGGPDNPSAPNYYVPFKDYIKNVASSEIYCTWPISTIHANIHAIISFTLNRVFTEWYRNKGKDFTITSSTEQVRGW